MEEIREFLEDESIEEIVDILEVVDAILEFKKFDKKGVEKIKNEKAKEKGKFKDKIILDES